LCGGERPGTPDAVKQQGYFLLVDRGGCSFVEKVRNAQADNATAVFVADNRCLCSFEEGVCQSDQEECEDDEPTMDDDGTGFDITIPSMLLLKPDGDKLRDELMAGTTVEVGLSWPIPKATNGVTEYTLWMTPDDLLSHQFLMSFLDASLGLGDKAIFRPKMFVSDGTMKGCRKYEGSSDPCPGFCTNYGRYCEPRSYYDFDSYDDKGTKMVAESLRRACIWHVYGDSDGIGEQWWRYVQNWIMSCGSSHYSTSCAHSLYEGAGIDTNLVEQCMADSGNIRDDTTNILLESSLDEADDFDVSFAPALFVNGAVVRGALTFGTALDAVCTSYEPDDIPDICFQWKACSEQCSKDTTCILRGESCMEYQVPTFSQSDFVYDDDYIENGYTSESELTSPEQTVANTDATTDAPIGVQTAPPVPAPTVAPVVPATDPPVTATPVSSFTLPPVAVATASPVLPVTTPTLPPVVPPPNPPLTLGQDNPNQELPPGYEDKRVVETIQIFESGKNNDIGFAVGLGVGIGVAVCFGCVLLFIAMRGRQTDAMMRPLVVAPSVAGGADLSMESGSYYPDNFRDDDDYSSDEYRDSHRKPRRKSRKNRARRSFQRFIDGDERRSVRSNRSSRSNRSRREYADGDKSKSLRRSMRRGEGELLSIGVEDEEADDRDFRSRNPYRPRRRDEDEDDDEGDEEEDNSRLGQYS
jgi:hypothetical protein